MTPQFTLIWEGTQTLRGSDWTVSFRSCLNTAFVSLLANLTRRLKEFRLKVASLQVREILSGYVAHDVIAGSITPRSPLYIALPKNSYEHLSRIQRDFLKARH